MGWFEIISIIIALIGFFVSKKSGASTTEAALIGAGAGLGTYYVGTQTEWGQDLVASIDAKWDPVVDSSGSPVIYPDGSVVTVPSGATPQRDANGSLVYDATGKVVYTLGTLAGKTVETAGTVLTSWGPTGTAAVVGTTALATSGDRKKWLPWIAGGAALLLLSRKSS